jgi:predicted RNase H-like nuclease
MYLGVDGYSGGWVTVRLGEDDSQDIEFVDHISCIEKREFDAAMIDMPIGLPETGYRCCDVMGRELLGEARSRLFLGARRPLLDFDKREKAHEWAKRADGKGVSCQLFCLLPKIKQVDDFMTPDRQKKIRETHPELVFQRLNAGGRLRSKKSAEGIAERRGLLLNFGFDRIDELLAKRIGTGAKRDDVLDACACSIVAREATSSRQLTGRDEAPDKKGLQMEIWY